MCTYTESKLCAPGFHCSSGASKPCGHTVLSYGYMIETVESALGVPSRVLTCVEVGGAPGPLPPTPP
jgi:hypothetical protein